MIFLSLQLLLFLIRVVHYVMASRICLVSSTTHLRQVHRSAPLHSIAKLSSPTGKSVPLIWNGMIQNINCLVPKDDDPENDCPMGNIIAEMLA
jgi:hypothetical protein